MISSLGEALNCHLQVFCPFCNGFSRSQLIVRWGDCSPQRNGDGVLLSRPQ